MKKATGHTQKNSFINMSCLNVRVTIVSIYICQGVIISTDKYILPLGVSFKKSNVHFSFSVNLVHKALFDKAINN